MHKQQILRNPCLLLDNEKFNCSLLVVRMLELPKIKMCPATNLLIQFVKIIYSDFIVDGLKLDVYRIFKTIWQVSSWLLLRVIN